MAFGLFLHGRGSPELVWIMAISYVVVECGILSVAWKPTQKFLLLGFKSDVGYTLMALGGASLAVVIVAWVQISSHFLVMIAAAMLLRVKLYTGRTGAVPAFVMMSAVSLAGLALSWLPTLVEVGQIDFFKGGS